MCEPWRRFALRVAHINVPGEPLANEPLDLGLTAIAASKLCGAKLCEEAAADLYSSATRHRLRSAPSRPFEPRDGAGLHSLIDLDPEAVARQVGYNYRAPLRTLCRTERRWSGHCRDRDSNEMREDELNAHQHVFGGRAVVVVTAPQR